MEEGYGMEGSSVSDIVTKEISITLLRVNIGKTKVMRCQVRIGQAEESQMDSYKV